MCIQNMKKLLSVSNSFVCNSQNVQSFHTGHVFTWWSRDALLTALRKQTDLLNRTDQLQQHNITKLVTLVN